MAALVPRAHLANRAHRANRDDKVSAAVTANGGYRVLQVHRGLRDLLVQLVRRDPKALAEKREKLASGAHKELRVLRAPRVSEARPAHKVPQVHLDPQAHSLAPSVSPLLL